MKRDCQATAIRAAHVIVPVDLLAAAEHQIEKRLKLFQESNNPEYLVDVATYAMRAWMFRRTA
jgi:hypothetical protein